jgi:REP element-mobilizing transposase RayT
LFIYATQPKYNIVNALILSREKGLENIHCIMHSHIHLCAKATNGFILSDVMRDFKKYPLRKFRPISRPESRRSFLAYFEKACAHLKEIRVCSPSTFRWQDGYHAEIIETNWFNKKLVYSQQSCKKK